MHTSFSVIVVILMPLLNLSSSVGQERTLEAHFSVTGALGASWNGVRTWTFETCDCAPIKPGIGFGLGVEYGPLVYLDGAILIPSIEVSFAEVSAKQSFSTGTIEGGIQKIPVMAWVKIMSDRRLSPFLRFGAGMSKTDFRENAVARSGPSIRFHEWNFSWGVGGGLNYQVGSAIALELFVEDWGTEKDILGVNSAGEIDGIFGRHGMFSFGTRVIVSL